MEIFKRKNRKDFLNLKKKEIEENKKHLKTGIETSLFFEKKFLKKTGFKKPTKYTLSVKKGAFRRRRKSLGSKPSKRGMVRHSLKISSKRIVEQKALKKNTCAKKVKANFLFKDGKKKYFSVFSSKI